MSDPIHVISLGAGVQSSTLALMAARGEVGPMPTAAVFADTQAEPGAVYKWLDWLEQQLPFPVYRVTAGSLTDAALQIKANKKTGKLYMSNLIPAYVRNPDGSKGISGRGCTRDHKIRPLIKKSRELAGDSVAAWHWERRSWRAAQRELFRAAEMLDEYRWHERTILGLGQMGLEMDLYPVEPAAAVVQWIGISLDEVSRMKPSRDGWCEHRWPLIEKRMTRHDCLRWMEKNGFPKPPRSACSYCPFHSDSEWRKLKADDPVAFSSAVQFEKDLQAKRAANPQKRGQVGKLYLHDSLRPLDEVDFSEDETQGQMKFHNECEGLCGV